MCDGYLRKVIDDAKGGNDKSESEKKELQAVYEDAANKFNKKPKMVNKITIVDWYV